MYFKKTLAESDRKLNKTRLGKGNKFRNISMNCELWLQGDDIKTYSTHNEEKSVAVERFIRNLNPKLVEGGQLKTTRWGFIKIIFSRERAKPCSFLTFIIIKSHIFHENFIKISSAIQKI